MARDAVGSPPEGRSFRSLRGRTSFSRVYREGTRRRYGTTVIFIAEGPAGPPHVGFVAGKRVGNAVARNRAKRRLREAVARVQLPSGSAWIIVALPGVNATPFRRLVGWVEQAARSGTVPGRTQLPEQEEQ